MCAFNLGTVSVLRAIDEDSPAVPSMLTDYILTGNISDSSIKFDFLEAVIELFGTFSSIF